MRIISALILLSFVGLLNAQSDSPRDSARVLIHLLDYLAQDYAGAVQGGNVISPAEYEEQKEFIGKAWQMRSGLVDSTLAKEVVPELSHLKSMIFSKADPDSVSLLARSIKQQILTASGIATAPNHWPSLSKGMDIFSTNCVVCHGVEGKGDGPGGAGLTPKPANFHEEERMALLSPFQVFNTIRLGVEGTGMPPFPQLSEQDIWDLSFYILSLRYQNDSGRVKTDQGIDLHRLSLSSDSDLIRSNPGTTTRETLAAWRFQSEDPPPTLLRFLETANRGLDQAKIHYHRGEKDKSGDAALFAYLDGIEPIEPRLRSTDARFVADLEEAMLQVRKDIQAGRPSDQVDQEIAAVKILLQEAKGLLQAKPMPSWAVFLVTLGILLRESFEALLVIIAILGVIKATGAKKAAGYVHMGWIAAVAAGFLAWIFSGWLAGLSGAGRELTEGISSLFAVVVLIYMGFWMHSKSEIDKWNAFIKSKVQTVLDGKSLLGLAVFSFIVVFREAFETVLFLSALNMEGAGKGVPILFGTVSAIALTLFVAWIFLRASSRIPIRNFFSISSFVMAFLAIVLGGKGLHALQEAGKMSITSVPWNFRFEFMGIYPTFETWGIQTFILAASYFILIRKNLKSMQHKPHQPQKQAVKNS
jgi:high-affinity iron transporter